MLDEEETMYIISDVTSGEPEYFKTFACRQSEAQWGLYVAAQNSTLDDVKEFAQVNECVEAALERGDD
jgi:hypothetical protein